MCVFMDFRAEGTKWLQIHSLLALLCPLPFLLSVQQNRTREYEMTPAADVFKSRHVTTNSSAAAKTIQWMQRSAQMQKSGDDYADKVTTVSISIKNKTIRLVIFLVCRKNKKITYVLCFSALKKKNECLVAVHRVLGYLSSLVSVYRCTLGSVALYRCTQDVQELELLCSRKGQQVNRILWGFFWC